MSVETDEQAQQASDEAWMRHALALAERGAAEGEVPVGAVLVRDGEIVGEGWNRPISAHDPSAHAEIQAIREAAQRLRNYRLVGTTLYVSLEPCTMCVGAIVHARIARVVFGAYEPKTGAVASVFSLLQAEQHNHRVDVSGGVLEADAADMLRNFFRSRRKKGAQAVVQKADSTAGESLRPGALRGELGE
ncbi:tRNA adenosine(34) deaminase TadA [Alkalilimnicola ehrlichii]|uniref:tRNA-specific adenosine deaminase n=1 Tax=Alkalilimnicola ehrlichii TaxID=351052 RepID=A0A3E0WLH4_9GAMM|nr:tRNA adenosine(34) deaminase TadA [Alkalilimnicola ehrlichii]RFA29991.1 tRNA adenosine(34) deaminase TadA [Alkalilimnicola ehrlichii]RFA33810.1 tRNA adenosine(34) deaminase TadA [Alkalilimnicola ehrlichii]